MTTRATPRLAAVLLAALWWTAAWRPAPAEATAPVAAVVAAVAPVAAAAAPAPFCTITDRRITESSGLAAGGDLLYTINDGGDRIRVFVLDRGCRVRRVIENRTNPYDVEDLARGPDGTLWVADIGDNAATRRTIALELLTEAGEVTLFRFTYPDGPHDAEALLVDRRGQPYIVTKEPLSARVYTPAGPPSTTRPTALRQVATLSFPPTGTDGGPVGPASQVLVTGAAVAPDGGRLVLRTYTDAYLWTIPNGDIAAALRSDPARRIALPATPQGEAVTFSADGRSLLTSTEGVPGPIHAISVGGSDPPVGPTSESPAAASPAGPDGRSEPAGTGSTLGNALVAALIAAGLVWGSTKLRPGRRR